MEKCLFNSMLSNKKLEHRCGLSKSMDSLDALGHTSGSEETILNDAEKKIPSKDSYSFSNIHYLNYLFDSRNIWSLISDHTFLVRNSNGDTYSLYFDIDNHIFDIDNASSFLSELEILFPSYLNSGSNSSNYYYYYSMYDTQSNWNNHINSCIDSYLRFEISLNSDIYSGIDSYISNFICAESTSSIESGNPSIKTSSSSFNIREKFNDFDRNTKYKQLWLQCDNCYGLNYKKFFRSKMNICEHCGYHLKMSSSDRIELFIDPGTWEPMDEDMVSMDPIEFHSEEKPYMDHISVYQRKTGLTEAVQTGVGQLNSIPIAIGVMDFQFMGGSMGSVVGEKVTRLIEYATNRSLPVIIVCASGGARMQEGSLSLMQMAKISSALFDYQSNKKLFYVSILTSPTTGGVTASFGMLGDIIIAEPNAYIAFAGKRVIEQTLKKTVPDGSQVAEYLFHKGLFDPIVPRNLLKGVLNELFQLHGFLPLNQDKK
uniref:acetyl-CoA carboxylase carboxyl transferase beta n=1 Tax=Grammatophyllum scriptum TaxID=256362 RepID=UPI002201B777|nr:acetyl-CoA carboxylase carboxyl transferase beta [Grammatophyllum scriptum]UXW65694.1 acetyl-CoA carboxylase carboxyl transferase beta [Grammatophyllum scriptum]UXW65774.1 acetyl-CoA carboxylase carboxyl transferase beta [Grammatophyllum scriptum]